MRQMNAHRRCFLGAAKGQIAKKMRAKTTNTTELKITPAFL
jgi:hypothetical protein